MCSIDLLHPCGEGVQRRYMPGPVEELDVGALDLTRKDVAVLLGNDAVFLGLYESHVCRDAAKVDSPGSDER